MPTTDLTQRYRGLGLAVLLLVCVPLTVINYLSYQGLGRFIIILLLANILLPPMALYMLATGKNPLRRTA